MTQELSNYRFFNTNFATNVANISLYYFKKKQQQKKSFKKKPKLYQRSLFSNFFFKRKGVQNQLQSFF